MRVPGFIHGSDEAQSFTADQQRTINWYVEPPQAPGGRPMLCPTPGVSSVATVSRVLGKGDVPTDPYEEAPGRAHFAMDGREFAVVGAQFVEIDQYDSVTNHGQIEFDTKPASICSNGDGGDQLFITSGGYAYYFTLSTNTLTQITALDGKATVGAYLDGYFLCLDASTSTLYLSALLDGSSWTLGTDYAQRSIAADPWVSMRVYGRYAWLLGEETSEAWYNSGGSFPLSLHPSSFIRYGCAAPWSVAVAENSILWLSQNQQGTGVVVQSQGFDPQPVSTFAIQKEINEQIYLSDAIGFVYSDLGHTFYVLSLPSAKRTWVYDLTTKEWHERGTWISERREWESWRPIWPVYTFNEYRILDTSSRHIYRMGSNIYTDVDSREIRRLRRAPVLQDENRRVFYSDFEVDLDRGQGTSGQAENPQVMLRMSDDNGKTWGREVWASAGKIGEYSARCHWHRLGSARRRVFEVSVTDPIPWRLVDAFAEVQPGQH